MKDLHLHLSASVDLISLYEILRKNDARMKDSSFFRFCEYLTIHGNNINSLEEYIEIIHTIDKVQSSPEAVENSFYKSFVDAYCKGCTYLELRWNPYKRSKNLEIDLDELIMAAQRGFLRAKKYFGIEGGQIFCLGRDIGEDENELIFKKAVQYHGNGVLGIDIAGSEYKYQLNQNFVEYYRKADRLGMITTIHSGEEDYPELEDTLAMTVEKFQPRRIGHGILIHRFPNLMKIASQRGIIFETCITSNLITKVANSLEEYVQILKIFENYNLKYQICTDATYTLDTDTKRAPKIGNYSTIK